MARARRKSEETAAIPVRFTKHELSRMERARSLLGLTSRTAVIRAAVLEKLDQVETTGILELREVTNDEAVKLIDRYLKKHPGNHYVSEFVEKLGIEPRVAFEAVQDLIEAGRAHEGEE